MIVFIVARRVCSRWCRHASRPIDVISGPAGRKRDWDRFRSLFLAQAHFIIASPNPADGDDGFEPTVLDVDSFIAGFNDHIGTEGFFERDITRSLVTYENTAHVFARMSHVIARMTPNLL